MYYGSFIIIVSSSNGSEGHGWGCAVISNASDRTDSAVVSSCLTMVKWPHGSKRSTMFTYILSEVFNERDASIQQLPAKAFNLWTLQSMPQHTVEVQCEQSFSSRSWKPLFVSFSLLKPHIIWLCKPEFLFTLFSSDRCG